MNPSTSLRRTPQQARGQRRIDTILDAAEQVLAEVGQEALTTNAVAARAHTSIGSLYQFFPNKDAVLQALAGRYLEHMRAVRDMLFAPDDANLGLEAWIDRSVDALAEMQATHPGFRNLFCNTPVLDEFAAADDELQQEVMEAVEARLAAWAPDLDPTDRMLYALISVKVVKGLLPLIGDAPGDQRDRVVAEIKILLVAYLNPVFGQAGAGRTPEHATRP